MGDPYRTPKEDLGWEAGVGDPYRISDRGLGWSSLWGPINGGKGGPP